MTWGGICRRLPKGHGPLAATQISISTCSSLQDTRHHAKPGTSYDFSNSISVFGRDSVARWISTPSATRAKRQALDRDVIVSVLEAAATRRDAKGYLQKYISDKPKTPETVYDRPTQSNSNVMAPKNENKQVVDVAVVKLRLPQDISFETLSGIAKTLSQLRVLGLTSLVIVDCGVDADRQLFDDQALRICEAIDSFGGPGAKLANHVFLRRNHDTSLAKESATPQKSIVVDDRGVLEKALQRGMIVVIPSIAQPDDILSRTPVGADETVLALTSYLAGLQFDVNKSEAQSQPGPKPEPEKLPDRIASVERLIILDPVGGTPMARRPGVSHRLINLEQEYDMLLDDLKAERTPNSGVKDEYSVLGESHASNLSLVRAALALLPPTSSALITTPRAAANISSHTPPRWRKDSSDYSVLGFDNMVTTRKQKNPLLHNLLTNRPAFSPSLPLQKTRDESRGCLQNAESGTATLVKKGMPVTIYPDPRAKPWRPAEPGSPRLRLTDNYIDLPRLVYLIEDSFGRKLDVESYLKRVNNNLAGIIIAGNYEGAAILTWELPAGISQEIAYETNRYVPYLDKFAVLRSQQGSSGVADIMFNSMVLDCFADGVCWRSRKDNPVNKWYFERSIGTRQLLGSNWTMFWTTADVKGQGCALQDYESVCRSVEPSWADKKHIVVNGQIMEEKA